MRRVSVGMRYRTNHDLNDGFGDRTGSCRECALSRDDPQSEVKLWITGNTEIRPVLEVKTFCQLHVHGIDILIHSTSGDNTNSWLVISRGTTRYADESRYNDPDSDSIEISVQSI